MLIGAIDTKSPGQANISSLNVFLYSLKLKQQWMPPGCPTPVASQLKVLSGSIF